MNSIRETIILNVISKMAEIRKNKGYNTDIGQRVYRADRRYDPDVLPAVAIWPQKEESTREYDIDVNSMPVRIEGLYKYGKGENPSVISELILADLKEFACGRKWTLLFDSGGTYRPSPGDMITGASSGASAVIESINESGGAWDNGDQEGSFVLRRKIGDFTAENLNVGNELNIASTNATISSISAEYSLTGDLADDILIREGGTDEYPESSDQIHACSVSVNIRYSTITGNPYNQPN